MIGNQKFIGLLNALEKLDISTVDFFETYIMSEKLDCYIYLSGEEVFNPSIDSNLLDANFGFAKIQSNVLKDAFISRDGELKSYKVIIDHKVYEVDAYKRIDNSCFFKSEDLEKVCFPEQIKPRLKFDYDGAVVYFENKACTNRMYIYYN